MRRIPWPIVVGVVAWWGLNGLISAIHVVTVLSDRGQPIELAEIVRSEIATAALWMPCTLWLLWCVARRPLEREGWAAALGWLLFAVLAVMLFRTAAVPMLDPWIGWRNPPRSPEVMLSAALRNALTSCLVIGVGHALVYARRSRDRERQAQALQEQLTQARLDALSAQLNPHFLFNALNSIAEMVHHDADAADRMLVQLGGLLRHSLESSRQQHTSLHDELAVIDCYIGIEQVRLGDRLRFHRAVDDDVLHAQVPRLMLQPLVENAVAHAVAHRTTPSTVEVRASRAGERLLLEVIDDGGAAAPKPGFGVGIANTRARLACLYGDEQTLDIEPVPGGGSRVRVSLPLAAAAPA